MSTQNLSFSTTLNTIDCTIDGQSYRLIEMTGAKRDKYLSFVAKKLTYDKDGKPSGMNSHEGVQSYLISLTLVKVNKSTDTIESVSEDTIRAWPASLQTNLYKIAGKLSAVDDKQAEAEIEAKNDSPASD